jgi:hypothetical protein
MGDGIENVEERQVAIIEAIRTRLLNRWRASGLVRASDVKGKGEGTARRRANGRSLFDGTPIGGNFSWANGSHD